MIPILTASVIVFSLTTAPIAGHQTAAPQKLVAKAKKTRVKVNFNRASFTDIVKWLSKRTGKNFIVPDHLHDRKITIISGTPVTIEEAYQAFLTALSAERLEVVKKGPFLLIATEGSIEKHAYIEVSEPDECEFAKGIRQIDETTWVIEKGKLDESLGNLNQLTMQARIVPSFKNGETNGFKLFAIRPCSLYAYIGFKNGDIIHRINGHDINTPDQALETYHKIRTAKTIEVEISRRGQPMKLTYRIE